MHIEKIFPQILMIFILCISFSDSAPPKNESAEADDASSSGKYTVTDYTVDIEKQLSRFQMEQLIKQAKQWVKNAQNGLKEDFDQRELLAKAFDIMDQVHSEGIKQPITLLFQRADYIICKKNSNDNDDSKTYELKQIKVNGGSISGHAFSEVLTKLHKQVLSRLGLNLVNYVETLTLSNTVKALYKAWLKFGKPNAVILIIDFPLYKHMESVFIRKHLLMYYGKDAVVLSLQNCVERLTLDENDFSLRLDQHHDVAVVFNQQTMLNENPDLMEVRRIIERSTAIKAPSLVAAFAHSKKMQQVLSEPGMVERFFPNPEEAPLIKAIRYTYANMWRIEENENNEPFSEIIERVKKQPNNFVLKKTEYALWNDDNAMKIYFGQEILENLANFNADKRRAYILMEKLRPVSVKNHIIWAEDGEESSGGDFLEEVTPELGIFGTLLGNIANGEVLYNAQLGHQLKTKLASENEGGMATGNSAYDSAYLLD